MTNLLHTELLLYGSVSLNHGEAVPFLGEERQEH